MTDDNLELEPFEDRPVTEVGIEIPSAGGGLHDALRLEKKHIEIGDEVTVAMRLRCRRVRFQPIDEKDLDAEEVIRIHTMGVVEATFVEAELVARALEEQRERVRALEEAEIAKTQPSLPMDGQEPKSAEKPPLPDPVLE